jgi:FkbM family methyltransferase
MKLIIFQEFNAPLAMRWVRIIPKFKGYWLVVCAIANLLPAVGYASLKIEDHSVIVPLDLCNPYEMDMYAMDKQELCVPAVMLRLIGKTGMLLDIGANCGWYSRIVTSALPKATVVALEPSERAFKFLRKFASLKLHCLPLAASDEDGKRLSSSCKIYRQSSSSAFFRTQSEYEGVASYTADSLMTGFGNPTFIKIDVEGAELDVLKGMSKLLQTVPYVLVEINDDSICSKFGYSSVEIYELMGKSGYLYQYDVCNKDNTVTLIQERKSSDVLFCKRPLDWVSVQ